MKSRVIELVVNFNIISVAKLLNFSDSTETKKKGKRKRERENRKRKSE